MAAGYLTALSHGRIDVRSAGSLPGDQVDAVAVKAMAEEGIDISRETPKVLTTESVRDSDVVITMGCGDPSPSFRASATRIGRWRIPPARTSRSSAGSATTSAVAWKS